VTSYNTTQLVAICTSCVIHFSLGEVIKNFRHFSTHSTVEIKLTEYFIEKHLIDRF